MLCIRVEQAGSKNPSQRVAGSPSDVAGDAVTDIDSMSA